MSHSNPEANPDPGTDTDTDPDTDPNQALIAQFKADPKPNPATRKRLARELGCDVRAVGCWFTLTRSSQRDDPSFAPWLARASSWCELAQVIGQL